MRVRRADVLDGVDMVLIDTEHGSTIDALQLATCARPAAECIDGTW